MELFQIYISSSRFLSFCLLFNRSARIRTKTLSKMSLSHIIKQRKLEAFSNLHFFFSISFFLSPAQSSSTNKDEDFTEDESITHFRTKKHQISSSRFLSFCLLFSRAPWIRTKTSSKMSLSHIIIQRNIKSLLLDFFLSVSCSIELHE